MKADTKSKRPAVFLAVGVLNTLLDFVFYTFLTTIVFDAKSIVYAGIISGTFALVCALLTHGLVTWRGRDLDRGTVLRFFVFTGFGMWVIRPILLSLFILIRPLYEFAHSVSGTIGLPFDYEFIASTGAFGFMVIIVLLYNYAVYDRYVFRRAD